MFKNMGGWAISEMRRFADCLRIEFCRPGYENCDCGEFKWLYIYDDGRVETD